MKVHLNIPRIDLMEIRRIDCPTCKKSRFFVCWFEEWYGSTSTCLGCGERWQDGEMCQRPFEPAWRKRHITQSKESYRAWIKKNPPSVDLTKTVAK